MGERGEEGGGVTGVAWGTNEGEKETEEEGKGEEITVGEGEGGREMEGRGGEISVGAGEGEIGRASCRERVSRSV